MPSHLAPLTLEASITRPLPPGGHIGIQDSISFTIGHLQPPFARDRTQHIDPVAWTSATDAYGIEIERTHREVYRQRTQLAS